jgi:DNA polymerase/3'-5' exonuclease PolX
MTYKEILIQEFSKVIEEEKKVKKENFNFKVQQFKKFIDLLYSLEKVNSIDDLKNQKGVGKGILTRAENIINQGTTITDPTVDEVRKLCSIPWVGESTALKLNKNGITLEDLLKNPQQYQHTLTRNQQLGLKHYKDLQQRIPREEIQGFEKTLIQSGFEFVICGSYRRGKEDSGDIDILLKNETAFQALIDFLKKNYDIEDLTINTKNKYMGIIKIKEYYRRIDILYIQPSEFVSSLLYFTGSQAENIRLRKKAIKLGFKLNEHGLWKNDTTISLDSEENLYEILEEKYKSPTER